jgi:hypothetical protein
MLGWTMDYRVDGSPRSHNPKVVGSNPPPATQKSADQSRSDGPALLLPGKESHLRAYHSFVKFRFMLDSVTPVPA